MKQIKRLSLAALAAAVVLLPLLMAPGGFPSRPRFQAVGIGTVAPSTVGQVRATGAVDFDSTLNVDGAATLSTVTATGAVDLDSTLNVDGAATFRDSITAIKTTNSAFTQTLDNDSNGTANQSRIIINSGDGQGILATAGSGFTGTLTTNGPTGAQTMLSMFGANPIIFATNTVLAATISGAQVMDFVNVPTVAGTPLIESGGYTGAVTGCTTNPAPSIQYQVVDRVVTIYIPNFSCTSNATSLTVTGAPVAIRPATNSTQTAMPLMTDNGANTLNDSSVLMTLGGTLTFHTGTGVSGWTNSGSKGNPVPFTFSYLRP